MDENNRDYTNGEITVYWRPKECIHATTCFRELRSVFNPSRRPWIDLNAAPTEEIVRVVELCPTKALYYKWNKDLTKDLKEEPKEDMKVEEEKKKEPAQDITPAEIKVMPDGPLVIKGEFKIIGEDGKEVKKMKITSLCRCGQSNKMPFCDGMHRKVGWFSR